MDWRMDSLLNMYENIEPKKAQEMRNALERAERSEQKIILFILGFFLFIAMVLWVLIEGVLPL